MNQQIISVSEFLAIINETLTFAFPEVVIEGEISSFKVNQGKWVFFDIKDSDSSLGCFMPLFSLKLPIEDGMKVRVTGSPKLTKSGKFSLTVRNIELAGEGELKRALAILKQRLQEEGIFDSSRKRLLPEYPSKIGLIASGQSAAYSDFVKILSKRWSPVTIYLANVQVQGAAAPDQIVNAIDYFNSGKIQVDTLVLIRGGGSLEDLQAFSTEPVTRAVAASRTPIVVGVGHEIDISLADLAADVRAATPTDAARLVAPDRVDTKRRIDAYEQSLNYWIERQQSLIKNQLWRSINILEKYTNEPKENLRKTTSRLKDGYIQYIRELNNTISQNQRLLRNQNPTAILQRGYAIVRQNNCIITATKDINEQADLMIQFSKGELRARPTKSK